MPVGLPGEGERGVGVNFGRPPECRLRDPPAMRSPATDTRARERHLQRARRLAHLLDRAVTVPGTRIGIGLDGLIGLVPGIGDAAGGVFSLYVLYLGYRAGAPASVLVRMAANVGIDVVVGAVPLLGDLFDLGFKANERNVALLDRSSIDPRGAQRASRIFVGILALLLVLVLIGVVALVVLVVGALGTLL